MIFSRLTKWMLLGALIASGTGCGEIMHNLQMHRLHRLNRVPDMMQRDGYNFSIPADPLPEFEASDPAQQRSTEKA